MKKISKSEKGLNVVELLLVVMVVVAIAAAGYLVVKHHDRKVNNTETSLVNPYSNWATYCSSYGGLCLRYPLNWELTTAVVPAYTFSFNTPSFVPAGSTYKATIISPDNSVDLVYLPSLKLPTITTCSEVDTALCDGSVLTDLSATKLTSANGLVGIEAYDNEPSINPPITAGLFVTSDQIAGGNQLLLSGTQKISSGENLVLSGQYFRNEGTHQPVNDFQQLYTINAKTGNNLQFSTTDNAKQWFASNDAKTISKILDSVSYKN